jgi:hypothetical protein
VTDQTPTTTSRKGARCSVDVPGLGLVDGRTREARLYGQAVADVVSDLGGDENVSRAELELVRRAAGLSVLAAVAESRLLAGEDVNISELVSVGNAQRRILATLGLQRRAVDTTPTVEQWMKATAEAKAKA